MKLNLAVRVLFVRDYKCHFSIYIFVVDLYKNVTDIFVLVMRYEKVGKLQSSQLEKYSTK